MGSTESERPTPRVPWGTWLLAMLLAACEGNPVGELGTDAAAHGGGSGDAGSAGTGGTTGGTGGAEAGTGGAAGGSGTGGTGANGGAAGSGGTGWCGAVHCDPEVLVPGGTDTARDLALDDSHVYFTVGTEIRRVAKVGGTSETLTGGLAEPRGIALDATRAYVIDERRRVRAVDKQGGAPVTVVEDEGGTARVLDLAITGSHLYWTVSHDPPDAAMGTVKRVPLAGGTPQTVATLPSGTQPLAVALNATHVFFTTAGDRRVMRADVGGGGLATLASELKEPMSIAVDAQRVVWTDLQSGVQTTPLDGGVDPVELAPTGGAGPLALSDTHAYFASVLLGEVSRVPLQGGEAERWVVYLVQPGGIAVDDSNVYVVNNSLDAAILKAPK